MAQAYPQKINVKRLNGPQKVAVLMIALGIDCAANIFQYLSDEETELVAKEIVSMRNVTSEVLTQVANDFYQMVLAQEYIAVGGSSFAQEILTKALGENKAVDVIKRVQRLLQVKGFNVLKDVEPNQLLTFIQKEHPQTIAFVMAQLNPMQAATILADLPPNLQNEVVYRFATMERVSPETISSVESVLESRIDFTQSASQLGGVKSVAEILNLVGTSTEKSILGNLSEQDPELATEIKNLMFVFDDLIYLDDRSIQKVLKEVDNKELALALKHSNPEVKKKLLANLSERAAQMVEEEIGYLGPVRLRDVEESQQRIIDIVRKLEEDGLIVIVGGTKAEEMVE
ncbi:flagellar motor switch protein FliG [bacterium]|nr:flagellar motor switch protein FliG [FCB group bacterium]MBL7191782.1 flagellar motor switch protein FliG [bacterium]